MSALSPLGFSLSFKLFLLFLVSSCSLRVTCSQLEGSMDYHISLIFYFLFFIVVIDTNRTSLIIQLHIMILSSLIDKALFIRQRTNKIVRRGIKEIQRRRRGRRKRTKKWKKYKKLQKKGRQSQIEMHEIR